jgi:DNA-binding MarR family transcriptional regulator
MTRGFHKTQPPDNSVDPLGEFPLGAPEYFFYLLFQTARQRDLAFDAVLASIGLSLVQWRALASVRRIENCTMSALARYSGVERTTLTRAADQLVERGFVERWSPEHDRRQVNLAMTEAGEAIYAEAVTLLKDSNQRSLERINPKQLREATRVLQAALQGIVEDNALAADLLSFGRPAGSPRT